MECSNKLIAPQRAIVTAIAVVVAVIFCVTVNSVEASPPAEQTAEVAQATQSVEIGHFRLTGVIKNGDREKPGYKVGTSSGQTYAGLALDVPIDVTRITSGMDLSMYSSLRRGYLEHIQMLMNAHNAALYKKYYGMHVAVECLIDFVGRYYTPVFCDVSGITSINPTSSAKASDSMPSISLYDFSKEYINNPVAADKKYKGRKFKISGRLEFEPGVFTPTQAPKFALIQISDQGISFGARTPQPLSLEQEYRIKKLSIGETVTFICTCPGIKEIFTDPAFRKYNYPVLGESCVLL